MTIFQIKILAITLMVIDHIGAFLFPDIFLFRIIGRLSFILFAWLVANGVLHTKNIYLYAKRLLIFGCISQIPYALVTHIESPNFSGLNIFFTLALGVLAIIAVRRFKNLTITLPLIFLILFIIEHILGKVSYGAYGIATILIFYFFYHNLKVAALLQAFVVSLFYTLPLLLTGIPLITFYNDQSVSLVQPIGILAIPIIALYNGQLGPKMKWAFYIFYPAHLLLIYGIHFFLW
jgi:hypothetical protein